MPPTGQPIRQPDRDTPRRGRRALSRPSAAGNGVPTPSEADRPLRRCAIVVWDTRRVALGRESDQGHNPRAPTRVPECRDPCPCRQFPWGSRLCSRVFAPAHSNLTFHYIIHNHAVETTHSAPHPARSTSTPLDIHGQRLLVCPLAPSYRAARRAPISACTIHHIARRIRSGPTPKLHPRPQRQRCSSALPTSNSTTSCPSPVPASSPSGTGPLDLREKADTSSP